MTSSSPAIRASLRLMDIGLASAGLLALWLPLLVCAILVRLDSPGPALFRQERVGRNQRSFRCVKLRTMSVGTPSAGTHEISAASVTRLGARLRRLKLDELPQLWNVLIGEMSLVGPRPCLPVQTKLIEERQKHGVFAVRPGITGPGQVAGVDMSEPERLAILDGQWAREQNLASYVRLIAMTVTGHGQGDRVSA